MAKSLVSLKEARKFSLKEFKGLERWANKNNLKTIAATAYAFSRILYPDETRPKKETP